MTNVDILRSDLVSRLDYHRQENQLSYAEAIGVLLMIVHNLQMEAYEIEQGDENE